MPHPQIEKVLLEEEEMIDQVTHQFMILKGAVLGFGGTIETFNRPGQNGNSARQMGTRSRVYQLTSVVDHATATAAQADYELYKETQGTIVDITDDKGLLHPNHAVLSVEVSSIKAFSCISGDPVNVSKGDNGFLLACTWSLMPVGDPTP